MHAMQAESLIRSAAQNLAAAKAAHDRDMKILRHLRSAEESLTDSMQRHATIQKAWEHVSAAEDLVTDFTVKQGVIRTRQELDVARRSPASADFERLRSTLRSEAVGPAVRLIVRRASELQEDLLAWIKIQELIASHLRQLSEITYEGLRESQ